MCLEAALYIIVGHRPAAQHQLSLLKGINPSFKTQVCLWEQGGLWLASLINNSQAVIKDISAP